MQRPKSGGTVAFVGGLQGYNLLEEIAWGNSGRIYLARDTDPDLENGRPGNSGLCVLKLFDPQLATTRFVQLLLTEAPSAYAFSHPSSARIIACRRQQDDVFVVSELIDGHPLSSLLRRAEANQRPIAWDVAVWIASRVANAMSAAHLTPWSAGQRGEIFHGALSPDNVYITFDGQVKVLGLGIGRSRMLLPPSRSKLHYRAPELFHQEKASYLTDIYGLGLTLHEAVTGRHLFRRDSVARTRSAILESPVPPASEYFAEISPSLELIMQRMIARSPRERPGDAQKVERALKSEISRSEQVLVRELIEQMVTQFPIEATARERGPLSSFDECDSTGDLVEAIIASSAEEPEPSYPDAMVEAMTEDIDPEVLASLESELLQTPVTSESNSPTPTTVRTTGDTLSRVPCGFKQGEIVENRYRILELIDSGGMAAVYRVEHLGLKQKMAMKVLHPEVSAVAHAAERFLTEARSVCTLDCPSIVRVNDFGRCSNGSLYLIMELLDGTSLSRKIESEKQLRPKEAVGITDQVLEGLEHAHAQRVVHRDLKPDNIMLLAHKGNLQAKILDFGIAKLGADAIAGGSAMTIPGVLYGTPRYMSPEQAVGDTVDARTDLYSVGVILYEMITGRRPFDGSRLAEIVQKVINEPPPPMGGPLEPVVTRAMSKEKTNRFDNASSFRKALATVRF